MEGVSFPFFGLAFSIEKIQYTVDLNLQELVDHSRSAVLEAQRLGNFFIDEARLNSNVFRKTKDEANSLISNFDYFLTDLDVTSGEGDSKVYVTELYLFE